MNGKDLNQANETFVPKGAMAFFLSILSLMAVIWLFVYFIMIRLA